jgi:hypothetical protein
MCYLIRGHFECVPRAVPPELFEVAIERVVGQLADEGRRRHGLVLREVLAPAPGEEVFLLAWNARNNS